MLQKCANLLLNQIEPLAAASQRKLASSVETILEPCSLVWRYTVCYWLFFQIKQVILCQLKRNKVFNWRGGGVKEEMDLELVV